MYRQGDVVITKIGRMPKGATPVARDDGRIILAYGEVTGHAHAIASALAELFREENGSLYLRVRGDDVALRHEEHGAISLPPGTYRVKRQREYTPEEIRNVAD